MGRVWTFGGKSTRTAGARRQGAEAARQKLYLRRRSQTWAFALLRHRDDQAATVPTAQLVENRVVVVIFSGTLVGKVNGGQHRARRLHALPPINRHRASSRPSSKIVVLNAEGVHASHTVTCLGVRRGGSREDGRAPW